MNYWLMKSEPTVYSIADLERDGKTAWEGVRNFQARNFMRDSMRPGDLVIFYHSNAAPSGAAGVGRIAGPAYADNAAFDTGSHYYDARSTPDKPLWFMVDVEFVARFESVVALETIKADPALEGILVAKRGMRLSIQPLSEAHFRQICRLAGAKIQGERQ